MFIGIFTLFQYPKQDVSYDLRAQAGDKKAAIGALQLNTELTLTTQIEYSKITAETQTQCSKVLTNAHS